MIAKTNKSDRRPWIVSSRSLVAEFFGVNVETVKQWCRNGAPYQDRRYDLRALQQWKAARPRDPSNRLPSTNGNGEALRRKREADADLSEQRALELKMRNELTAGALVDVSDVGRNLSAMVLWIKAGAEGLPERLARLSPSENRAGVIEEVTVEIRRWLRYMGNWQAIEGVSGDDVIVAEAERILSKRESNHDN